MRNALAGARLVRAFLLVYMSTHAASTLCLFPPYEPGTVHSSFLHSVNQGPGVSLAGGVLTSNAWGLRVNLQSPLKKARNGEKKGSSVAVPRSKGFVEH